MSVTTTATRTFRGVEVPAAGSYTLDRAHTNIAFSVRHMMVSKVRGRFTSFTGSLVITEEFLTSSVSAARAGFGARAEIDRDDFGLTWNQALEAGGVMVDRKVTIDADVEAVLQRQR